MGKDGGCKKIGRGKRPAHVRYNNEDRAARRHLENRKRELRRMAEGKKARRCLEREERAAHEALR